MLNFHIRYIPLLLCLCSSLIAGCGGEDIPDSGEPLLNATGGLSRANNFSFATIAAPTQLGETRFDSLGVGFLGTPLITSYDQLAVVTTDRRIACIRYNTVRWTWQFQEEEYPLPELACNQEGSIYAVTTNQQVVAIDSAGNFQWKKSVRSNDTTAGRFDLPTAPIAVQDGVVVGTTGGVLKKFDRSGNEVWSLQRGAGIARLVAYTPELGFVCGITQNDYQISDTLLALNPDGSVKWTVPLPNLRIECGPVVVGEHVVVGIAAKDTNGRYQPFVLSLDANGAERWRVPLKILPLGITGDSDGNIYVNGGGGSRMGGGIVASFDPQGTQRWELVLSESIPSRPIVSSDWVCFVAFRNQTLGLYTYNREGSFASFTSIDLLSEINATPVILPYGSLVIAAKDEPVFLRNTDRGALDFLW